LPAWVARDRVAGARAAHGAGVRVLLLDDGFQDPALAKDLSLLAVDGGFGFGNGRVVPAGPLREPLAGGLARAQGAVLIGEDRCGVVAQLSGRLPPLRARLEPPPAAAAAFEGKKVFAFAGIGRPEKFFETLRALGAELAATRDFPDHHPYGEAELDALAAEAERLGALAVTTEKDLARIPSARRGAFGVLPVSLVFEEPQALHALLAPLLATARS
ncbi:MAG: tetraacyldisaccharide 4'-kinase, partial [Kiloniellales bacterium]